MLRGACCGIVILPVRNEAGSGKPYVVVSNSVASIDDRARMQTIGV